MNRTFIDSDGVIADFKGWVRSISPNVDVEHDDDSVRDLMVRYYKRCFLDSKPLPSASTFLRAILEDNNCWVLTSTSSRSKIVDLCEKYDLDLDEVMQTFKENKLIWFERLGIPRSKVIVVEGAAGKLAYCEPGDVLCDDFSKNVREWNNAGGKGILVNS